MLTGLCSSLAGREREEQLLPCLSFSFYFSTPLLFY